MFLLNANIESLLQVQPLLKFENEHKATFTKAEVNKDAKVGRIMTSSTFKLYFFER